MEEETGELLASKESYSFEGTEENLGKLERWWEREKQRLVSLDDDKKFDSLIEHEEF